MIEHVPQVASTGEWDWLVQALHTAFSSLRESSSSSSAEALGLVATRRASLGSSASSLRRSVAVSTEDASWRGVSLRGLAGLMAEWPCLTLPSCPG